MSLNLENGSPRENHRSSRRDELGEHTDLLFPHQQASNSPVGWLAFGKDLVAESRFRTDREIADSWRLVFGGYYLSNAAKQLEAGGADCCAICLNTMHAVFDQVSGVVQIPCLHIADALGEFAAQNSIQCLGLLGT